MELFQARGNYLYFIMFFQMRHCSDSVMSGNVYLFVSNVIQISVVIVAFSLLFSSLSSDKVVVSPKKLDFQEVERVEKSACTTLGQHVDVAVRAVETMPVVASFQL